MASVSVGRKLSGPEKAAIFLLALGEERSIPLLEKMEEHEVRAIAARTARLGTVDAGVVEHLFSEFDTRAGGVHSKPRREPPLVTPANAGVQGHSETPTTPGFPLSRERQLEGSLWERMADIHEAVLADLLAKEHPQTAAVVLSKIEAGYASRVLALCPRDFASDVIMRMARLGSVNPAVLSAVEQSLGTQLSAALGNGGSARAADRAARPPAPARGRGVNDLPEVGPDAIRALIGAVERDKLLLALKAASDEVRHRFFAALPERARAVMMDDLAALEPARVGDAEAAERLAESGIAWAGLRSRP